MAEETVVTAVILVNVKKICLTDILRIVETVRTAYREADLRAMEKRT